MCDDVKEIAIIGSGPHALASSLRFLTKVSSWDSDSDLTSSRAYWNIDSALKSSKDITVIDDSGEWLHRWDSRFTSADLTHLRSILTFQPDPSDNDSLLKFATSSGRLGELIPLDDDKLHHNKIKGKNRKLARKEREQSGWAFNKAERYRLQMPSISLFNDFCREMIQTYGLDECVKKGRVVDICPHYSECSKESDNCPPSHYTLVLESGQKVHAKTCVVCVGSNAKAVPEWAKACPRGIHSDDIDAQSFIENHKGEKILVVGGGQTGAHLSRVFCESHSFESVTLIHRRYLRPSHFDSPLHWAGKRGDREMAHFRREEHSRRAEIADSVLNGGSVQPSLLKEIRSLSSLHQCFKIRENVEVKCVKCCECSDEVTVTFSDGSEEKFNWIVLATGYDTDFRKDPLLSKLNEKFPIPSAGKYPILTDFLQWRKDWRLFVQGPHARLIVGPLSHTLEGARRCSTLVVDEWRRLEAKQSNGKGEEEGGYEDYKANNFFNVLDSDESDSD